MTSGLAASDAISPAAADVLRACKERLVLACLDAVRESGQSAAAYFGRIDPEYEEDDLAVLEAYMRLDETVLERLAAAHARAVRQIAVDTWDALGGVLAPEALELARARGLGALLAGIDYAVVSEFFCRMNELPAPGRNEGDYRGLFCARPFEYAEIATRGRTFVCCPLRLPTVVGDAGDGSFMDVWNSDEAQSIRRSILDGSFSHCLEKTCPALQSRALPRREDVVDPFLRDVIDESRTVLDRGPATIFMNYDRSCNLACPTCRTRLVILKGERREQARSIQDWATAGHLKDARFLHITGSGDAFGSNLFHAFLRRFDPAQYPDLRISVGTNGLLLTERNWERICADSIDVVVVSVDAATPESYLANRGGDYRLLVENLEFVGRLRASGKLKLYGINFVVQENNFAEMPAFVALGKQVGVDTVCFMQLTNWGTFSQAEFDQRAIHRPSHPRYEELLRALADPVFEDPVVDLSNLYALRLAAVR